MINFSADNIDDIVSRLEGDSKLIVQVLLAKMEQMDLNFSKAMELKDAKILSLESNIDSLQSKLSKLDGQLDDCEQYERRDTLIIAGEAVPDSARDENQVHIIAELLKAKLNFTLSPNDVSTVHRLGKAQAAGRDRRPFIVKFCKRDTKNKLMTLAKTLKGVQPTLFINESLTPRRRSILFALRGIKRKHSKQRGANRLVGCSSWNGNIFAYTSSARGSETKKHDVTTHAKLKEFVKKFVKEPLETFLENWTYEM